MNDARDSIVRNPKRKVRGKKDVNVWNDSQNGSDILSWAGDMLSFPGIAGRLLRVKTVQIS